MLVSESNAGLVSFALTATNLYTVIPLHSKRSMTTQTLKQYISCKRYNTLIPFHVVALARRIGYLQAAAIVTLLQRQLPGLNILTNADEIVVRNFQAKTTALNQDRLHISTEEYVLF
jgi:hypothetical protein